MATNIELSREPDGRWAARVPAVPGLAAFGDTQEESLAVAKNVAAILLRACDPRGSLILGFYPGRIPNDTRAKAVPPAQ
jgi:predicted RNase H-like HicB family nuclease